MKSFAVVALGLIFAPAALAQHQTFTVNPDASEVKMKLNTTHEVVNGTFHVQSGSLISTAVLPNIGDRHRRSGQRQDRKRQPR